MPKLRSLIGNVIKVEQAGSYGGSIHKKKYVSSPCKVVVAILQLENVSHIIHKLLV